MMERHKSFSSLGIAASDDTHVVGARKKKGKRGKSRVTKLRGSSSDRAKARLRAQRAKERRRRRLNEQQASHVEDEGGSTLSALVEIEDGEHDDDI